MINFELKTGTQYGMVEWVFDKHCVLNHKIDSDRKTQIKQVIIVNQSLKLPKGKLAAQVAHAAVAAFVEASDEARANWLEEGMPKVVVQAPDEIELHRLLDLAIQMGIPAVLIEDAGRTVVPEGTITCLGLGPAPDEDIDRLTGDLHLV